MIPTAAPTAKPTAGGVVPTPTPAPTATPKATPSPTAAPSAKPTPTTSPIGAPTGTPSPSPVASASPSPVPSPTATPTARPTASPTPRPSPTATPPSGTITFNDYSTFGYDNQRDVFNPNSTSFTPATLSSIHLAWESQLHTYNTQTQPVLATEISGHAGVLFVGGASGIVYAYDATTGSQMWTRSTGQEVYTCEGGVNINFGIGGTVAYDAGSRSLYVVGNKNSAPNATATNTLYHLDAATGAVLGSVNFGSGPDGWNALNFSHTSVTLGSNGIAYVGTGATCDISSWIGRIAAINVPSMTIANTFYPTWNGTTEPWGGGGIWGWGGVSLDYSGNVVAGIGNTDNGTTEHGAIVSPFQAAPKEYSGYGEAVVKLSSDLGTVQQSDHPIPTSQYSGNAQDLDLNGTPAIFQPSGIGCDPMAAIQGKAGVLYLFDENHLNDGTLHQYQLAPSTYADGFLGDPAFSPVTNRLYVGVSSSNGSLYAPGMMAIDPGCGSPSVAWHSAFGPDSYDPGSTTSPGTPRSVPAASAGGVVFIGTLCTLSGSTCGPTMAPTAMVRKPLICCTPPNGTTGGALWAVDASTGTVLNGGNPLIVTGAPLRAPPTLDGKWLFVLDTSGNLYGLTLDPNYPAIQNVYHPAGPPPRIIEKFRQR